jgi:hypothetical protein
MSLALLGCASEHCVDVERPTSFAGLAFTIRDAESRQVTETLSSALADTGMRVHRADAFPKGYVYVLAEQKGSAEIRP